MAKKRMFSNMITSTDDFLSLPLTTQCLYFHLNMNADDDGFVGNPKTVMKMIGASEGDMDMLKDRHYVLSFQNSGVIVITHWRLHNTLSKDRYKETTYLKEKSELLLEENKSYSLTEGYKIEDSRLIEASDRQVEKCRRTKDAQKTTTDKNRLEKRRKEKNNIDIGDVNITDVYFPDNLKLNSTFTSYVDMRKKIKKPLSDYAIELAIKKLETLAGNDDELKIKILEQSVFYSWQGLFEVKDNRQSENNTQSDAYTPYNDSTERRRE